MLRSLNELQKYAIGATDGDIGKVKDFYFDDHDWVGRYDIQPEMRPVLDEIGRNLERNVLVTIVGHTDSTGGDAMNEQLALDRAGAVRDYLTRSHVAARCRELAAQVALQVVALADGIEDHVAAPRSPGSDAAFRSISDAPLRRTHGARGNSSRRLRRTPPS